MTVSPRKRLQGAGADEDLSDDWVAANTFDFVSPSKRGRRTTSRRRASILATAKLKKRSPINRRQSVLLKRLDIPEGSPPSPPGIYRRTRRQSVSHIPRKQDVKPPVPKSISERALPKPSSSTKLPPQKSQLPSKITEDKPLKKAEEKTTKKGEETAKKSGEKTSKKAEKTPMKTEKKRQEGAKKVTPKKSLKVVPKKDEEKAPKKTVEEASKKAEEKAPKETEIKAPKKMEVKAPKKAEEKAPKNLQKSPKTSKQKTSKRSEEKISKKIEKQTPKKTEKASKKAEEKPIKKTQVKISPPRRLSLLTKTKSQPKLTPSVSLRGHQKKSDSDLLARVKNNQSETKKINTVKVSAIGTMSRKGIARNTGSPKQSIAEKPKDNTFRDESISPEKFYASSRTVYQVDEDISFTMPETEEKYQPEVEKVTEIKAKATRVVAQKSKSSSKVETSSVTRKSPLREKAKALMDPIKTTTQTPRAPSPAKKRTRSSSVKVVKKVKITATSPEGTGSVFKRTPGSNRTTKLAGIGSNGASPDLKESKVLKITSPTPSHKTPKKAKPFTPKPDPTPSRVLRQSMKRKVSTEIKAVRKVTNKENIEALLDTKMVSVTAPGKTPGKTSGMNSVTPLKSTAVSIAKMTPGKTSGMNSVTPVDTAAVSSAKMTPVKNSLMNSELTTTKTPLLMVSARSSVHKFREPIEENDRIELLPTTPVSLSTLPSTPTSSKRKTLARDGSINSAYTGRRLLRMRQTIASELDVPPRSSTPIRDITAADDEELDVTNITKDSSTSGETAEVHINKFEDANEEDDDEQEEEDHELEKEEEEEETEEEKEEEEKEEEEKIVKEAPPPSSRRYCVVM